MHECAENMFWMKEAVVTGTYNMGWSSLFYVLQEQLYEEERRRKILQEEADIEARRHNDFFT